MSQILLCLTQKTVKKIPQKTVSAFKPIISVDKFRARCQRGSMMGRMTLITGGQDIVYQDKPLLVIPLYHPAAALYNGNMRQVLIDDFLAATTIATQS